jgi:hypothetical protein
VSSLANLRAVIKAAPPLPEKMSGMVLMQRVQNHLRALARDGVEDDGSIRDAMSQWSPGEREIWEDIQTEEYEPDPELDADAETTWATVLHAAAVTYGVDTSRWQSATAWAELKAARHQQLENWRAFDADKLKRQAIAQTAPATNATFQPMTLADLRNKPKPTWVIDSIMPARSFAVTYGQPAHGKSFIAVSMALHVAAGAPWAGYEVDQGGVFYLAGEGADGLLDRIEGAIRQYGFPADLPFWVLETVPNLHKPDEVKALAIELKRFAGDTPVRCVFIDTWSRATAGADENSAGAASKAIASCAILTDVLGCTVCPIHHEGKASAKGLRGSNALEGAADNINHVGRARSDREDVVTFTTEKQKNAPEAPPIRFDLMAVHGTLVPVYRATPNSKPAKLTRSADIARRILASMGGSAPEDDWRDQCTADTGLSDAPKQDSRRKAFRTARDILSAAGIATLRDGVWMLV